MKVATTLHVRKRRGFKRWTAWFDGQRFIHYGATPGEAVAAAVAELATTMASRANAHWHVVPKPAVPLPDLSGIAGLPAVGAAS